MVKIMKFLDTIKHDILFTPDLSIKTIKYMLSTFQSCLSELETRRWNTQIELLLKFNTTQETITKNVKRHNKSDK